nr:unnamed protein product [Callosobruchus chinensis]
MGVFFLKLFLPNNIKNCSDTELHKNLSNILEQFGPLLGNPSITQFMGEAQLFKTINSDDATNDIDPIELLHICRENHLNIIYDCIKILLTIPVSVATAERSFSKTFKNLSACYNSPRPT